MPFLAGSQHMSYLRFFIFNTAGCVLWASAITLLGYFFGDNWRLVEKWMGRASVIVGAFVALLIGCVWLWNWVDHNEEALRERWHDMLERPGVAAFCRRYARQIEFLQNRISPGGYLGLHLTVGIVVIVLSVWWFGGIVQDLLAGDPLVVVDHRVAYWFNQHATPGLTRVIAGLTFFGSFWFVATASVAAALFCAIRRRWHDLLALTLTMACGGALNWLLKELFERPRPAFAQPIAIARGFGFPSGHTMGSTLFYGFLAVALVRATGVWRWRVLILIAAAFIILLMAFSRVYLGVHYLSDVMGGMAAGIAWLALSLTAVDTNRRRTIQSQSGTNPA